MSPSEFLESKDRFLYQAFNALSRWRRRKRNHSSSSKGKSFYFRPSLDGLEQRFLPASLLTGTQVVLGINDGGSFVIPNDKGTLVGLQFAGSDLLSPGTPLGGFSVSANNQSYFNYYYQSSLTGTLTDVSTPGTQSLRFVSKTIPGLTITRQISMPTDSRQILVSMTFENTTNLGSQPKTFTNLASMEIDDPDPNGFITVNDVLGLDNNSVLGRGNSTSGLTFGLFSSSTTAYASIVGTESGFGFTDSDPLLFLPSPRGTLPAGVNDPNGKSQDLPIRLADSIPSLAPGKSATLYSTIIVGTSTSQVDADATSLARNTTPTGTFDALTGPKNSAVSSASITFGLPVVGLKASDFSLTFKGTPVPLSGLTLVALDGGNGTHFRLDGLSSFTRSEGDYQLTLNTSSGARDMAGRALTSPTALSWKLDNTPPNAPIFTGFSPNTGGRPSDPLTNASQVILSGEAEAGAKVEIASPSSDGGFGTILASPVADSTGKWTATISTSLLKEGTVPLVARATDTSGNVSSQYGGFSFRLDLTAPALPGIPNITQDTGFSSTDRITRETTPTLSGNAEANSQILIQLVGKGTIGTSQADKDGNWTFNWPSSLAKLSDGTNQFQISAIDAAGNQSAIRTFSVQVDTVAPSASTLDSTIAGLVPSGDLLLSNGQSVVLTGKGEAGSSVSLAFDKSVLGTAIIGSDGRWSVPVNFSAFSDGKYNLLLNTTDTAGNTNSGFGPAIVIDTGPPVPPTIQSAVGTAGKTIFNGQASNAPVVILTGISEPNSLVEVNRVGAGVVGTIRTGADGKWTLTTNGGKSFTDGSYNFAARALDDVGNTSTFGAPFAIQIDTVAPGAPVIQGVSPDTGLPADGITKLPRLDVFGSAEPGSTVRLDLAGFGKLGTAIADNSGKWLFSVNDGILKDGVRQLLAQATDPAGNTGASSDNFQVTIDTVAPSQPAILEASGDANNDGITNDNFPTLRGLAEPFSQVEVSIVGLGIIGQVQADDSGSWILPWSSSSPLGDGIYQVTATATDTAGNRGNPSNSFSIQIDTAAPNPPVILGITPDTGLPGDAVTAISHLDIFGDAEPSSTVQIELAGFGVLGTTTTDASGRWHFEVLAGILTDGAQQFVATATDISGNTGSPSDTFRVVLDTVAPVNTQIVGLSGDTNSDRISTDNTPDFTGIAEPSSMVEVSISGIGVIGQVQADSSGNWFLPWNPKTFLTDGTYQVSATATDIAGNKSDSSPLFQVVIDTTAPLPPVISKINPDTGKDSTDLLTSSAYPVLSGFAEPGSVLTLTQNESGFSVQALVAADGSWHADFSSSGPLGDGTWTFTAVATDTAGNTGSPSDPFAIKVDTLAPVIPTFSGLLNDTGIDSDDLVTNSLSPGLKGLAEPGSTIILSNNDLEIGRVKAGADGRWSFDMASQPLTEGTMHFRVRSEDDAGNLSDWSSPLSVMIDTTSPNPASDLAMDPITGNLAGLPLVNQGTVSLNGFAESDSTIQVTLDGTDLGSLVTNTGAWSILLGNSLSEGIHTAQVRVTDRAGNSSTWASYSFGVDVTPPSTPVINGISPDTGSNPADALTKSDQVSISGSAEPGASLEISLDGLVVGNIVTDTTGNWTFPLPVRLGNGIHQVGIIATDRAGNQSVDAGQFSFTVDTIAPNSPLVQAISPDSGIDGDGLVNSRDLSILGVAEPFSRIDVFAGSNLLGTVQVDDKGNWVLKIPDASQAFLTEGKNLLRAKATDQAGNTSTVSSDFALTLDTQKPAKPSLTSIQADTGIPGDLLTSDRHPLILGNAEPFSIVQVFLADKLLGATTADSLGNWKFQPLSDLPLGSNPIRLRAIDVAGNFGDLADPVAINVNIEVPPVPLILGFATNSGDPSDWITSANQVTLKGSAKPNTFIDILVRGNFAGRVQTDDKGVWSFAIPTYLAEGSYDIQARSISLSGVESPLSGVATIKVDNTPPVIPVIDAVTPDTGSSSTDFITKSGTLVLKGHGEAGATVEVRLDAVVAGSVIIGPNGNWEVALGDNLANRIYKITVRSTDLAGNQSDWSKDSTLLVDKVAPDVEISQPTNGGIFNDATWPGAIQGSVSHPPGESEIKAVWITLQDTQSGKWFDGTSFSSTTPVSLGATLQPGSNRVNWSLDLPSSKLNDSKSYQANIVAEDVAGNQTEPEALLHFALDRVPPKVVITPITAPLSVNFAPLVLDLQFSESIIGLDATDFALPNGGKVLSVSGSGDQWSVTIQPGVMGGQFKAYFIGQGIQDLAGNQAADVSFQYQTDVGDTLDNAYPLTLNSAGDFNFTGSFETTNRSDWFKLPLPPAGQGLEMNLGGVTSPILAGWYDASGKLLSAAIATPDSNGTLRIQPTAQARFLRIEHGNFNGTTTGSFDSVPTAYSLHLGTIDPILDPQGNSQETAQAVAINNNRLSAAGDKITLLDSEYMRFTAPSTGFFDAAATPGVNSPLNATLVAYDAQGHVLAIQAPGQEKDSGKIRFPIIAGRDYYLRVESLSDANGLGGTGKWSLTGQFTLSPDAGSATKGTGAITTLDSTGRATLNGALDFSGAAELSTLSVETSGNYLVRLNPKVTSPDLTPRIIVLDQNFQMVQESIGEAGTALTANLRIETKGTYYLLFAGKGGTTGNFDGIIQTDDLGTTPATAGQFKADQGSQKASGTIDLSGDQDLFRFVAPATGVYQIVLKSEDGSMGQFGFASSNGSIPTGTANSSVGKFNIEAGQTLYLRIEGIDSAVGKYNLELTTSTDDYTDLLDPTKATSIQTGMPLPGKLEAFCDKDFFSWTAPSDASALPPFGAFFASALSDSSQPVDTFLTVYRVETNGSVVQVDSNNDSFLGSDAVVFFQASAGTTYLFEVRGAHDLDTGSYKFALNEDRLQKGDSNPGSFQLARLDKQYQLDQAPDLKLSGAIQSETHQDIVRFVPSQSGTWILKADAGQGSRLDPYMTLFDSSYAKIASDDNSGPGSGSLILTNLVEGAEYFISVSSTSGAGAYSLSAQLFKNPVQTNTDDFPADKTTPIAPSIQSATKQSGNIDFAGDTDTFTFQWPDNVGSATLTARLDPGSKSSVDPYLTILDTSGNILYSSDNTGSSLSSTVVFDVDPGQKLLIRASGANKSLGSYNLSIEPIAQPASDDFPGSPTAANMPVIALSDTTSQVTTSVAVFTGKTTGKIDQLGDRDFVKVVAPIDGMLTATYSHDKGTFLNPYLRAFGSDSTGGLIQLTSDDDSQGGLDSKLQVRVKAGQEILLLATGAAGTTGSYSIDVGIRQDDIGDQPSTAQPLRLDGLKSQATGTIETGTDTDLFIYQPTRSGSITAHLTGMSGDLNPYLFVYQARDGALVTSNNDISPTIKDSQIQMQVEAGETYFFSVRSAGNTMGDYSLDIAPVIDDYPSTLKAARILPLDTGNQGSITGKIEAIGDSDWFRVIPGQDGILRVRVDGVGPTAVDPTLAVYNDAGQVISTSDDTIVNGVKSTGSEVSLAGRAGRSYFIRAMGYGESTGSYEVKVETGTAVSDDFGNTIDTADLLDLNSSNQATFEGFLGAADQDVVRFIAPLTGDFVVTYSGQTGQLRALTRDNGETLQVASGDLSSKQGTFRFHVTQGQEVFLYATSPDDSKIVGGSFKAEIKLVEGAATNNTVSGDVVNSLNNTLTQTFSQLIGQGTTNQDFYQIRDQITKALIENLKAASGGSLTTSYLVIWLDPVDFVVTDSASQQIGSRASQGSINENASASLSQKGALDLVIIPGASASNYNMQLFGVGGGRVLAGATMVQSDGTVVNPKVTVNGSSNDSGIPVGSVPKEGLSLSLDFRGEQTTEVPSMQAEVASIGNAAQQIVGSLVKGVSTGTGAVGDLAVASAEFEVSNMLTLLVGADSDLAQVSLDETINPSPFAWDTKEGKELVSLVRNFTQDISDSLSKGLRLIARDAQIPAEEILVLVKTSLDRLGLENANSVVSKVGSEARNMLTRLIDRDLKVELVNKPMKQFWSGLLKELESGKIGKALSPAASKAIRDAVLSNANLQKETEPERQAEKLSKAETKSDSNRTASAELNQGQQTGALGIAPAGNENSLDPLESIHDDLWLNGFNQPNQPSPSFKNDPARDESTDALFGMVAAALLVPTWISSGPGDRKKRPGSPLGIGNADSEKDSDRTA